LLPGLKGFVNWGGFPLACERICAAGFAVFGIDFSRNGVENFGSEITRIDLAEGNSPSRQAAECEIVYNMTRNQELLEGAPMDAINADKVFVWGHSLGGGTALRFAERHPELAGVVTWASV